MVRMNDKRSYGIDLLRLIAMFMVCTAHILGQGGVLEACELGSLNFKVYWGIEILAIASVDVFAVISGYIANDKRTYRSEKVIDMWMQAFFYSFIITVVLMAAGITDSIEGKELIKYALPVLFGSFWYFKAYFLLLFAMPVLNPFLFSMEERTAKKTMIVMFVLFTFTGMFTDPFVIKGGYSALWLMTLYCIGVLAKRTGLFARKNTITLMLLWALSNLLIWIFYINTESMLLVSHVSPFVLMNGILLVVLFSRLQLKGSIIKKITPMVFGVYLFHVNPVIWKNAIDGVASFCVDEEIAVGVIYILGLAATVFICGIIVEAVRRQIFKLLKIHLLSKRIVKLFDNCVIKAEAILD